MDVIVSPQIRTRRCLVNTLERPCGFRGRRKNKTMKTGVVCALLLASAAYANHPVLVEGNCNNPSSVMNVNTVPPGTCGDYDGDGRIGTAEDEDGDRVFGTIAAALGGGTAANQNGMVTIVTSGTFPEQVNLTGANGNVVLQAAPGVEAVIDAVLGGDMGSGMRQGQAGIVVNSPADRRIIIRNVTVRNWLSGIQVMGNSRVVISDVRLDSNVNFGIEIKGDARVSIDRCEVHSTGFRAGAAGNAPTANAPSPGKGIEFGGASSGTVSRTAVTNSFGAGISDQSSARISLLDVYVVENGRNFDGFPPNSNWYN